MTATLTEAPELRVEQTVVVDAAARKVVRRYRDENPRASRKLMSFFNP